MCVRNRKVEKLALNPCIRVNELSWAASLVGRAASPGALTCAHASLVATPRIYPFASGAPVQLTFDTSSLILSCAGTLITAGGIVTFWLFRNYVQGVGETIKALEQRMAATETTIAAIKEGFAWVDQRMNRQDASLDRIEQRLDNRH